jgi:hypothetical protein
MSTLRSLVRVVGLQALGGLAVWLIVAVMAASVDTAALDLLTVLLLFAQLVIVPLGLLMLPAARWPLSRALSRGGRVLFRLGGVAAIASLAVPRGELSAAVAGIYLLPALLIGTSALLDARSLRSTADLAGVGARLMLVVGALLFVLHRQDVAFAGLPELAVQLGAVHLHFVGFGLLLTAGALMRRSRRMGGLACWLLLAGTVPASVGSLVHPALAATGGVLVLGGLLAFVAGSFTVLVDPRVPPAARRLLFVSMVCAIFVGVMGALSLIGAPAAEVGSMVRLHGAFAAVGVVFIGLLGWRLVEVS